jgi:hypothetical protein
MFRALIAVVAGSCAFANCSAQNSGPPPGTERIQAELRAVFALRDLNRDNLLDKAELAKWLIGPQAKAFDSSPEAKKPEPKKPEGKKPAAPEKKGPAEVPAKKPEGEAKKPADPAKKPEPKRPNEKPGAAKRPEAPANEGGVSEQTKQRPDYQFLIRLDKDGDGKINRAEWEEWSRGAAVEIAKYNEMLRQQAELELLIRQRQNDQRLQQQALLLQRQIEELRLRIMIAELMKDQQGERKK